MTTPITIPYPDFVAGTTIQSSQVDANNDAIVDYINDTLVAYLDNHDAGTATWANVYVVATAANPVNITGNAATTELSISNSATDGDPILSFELSASSKLTMGVDDSDSDKFKMAHAATLGTASTDDLIIDTTTGAVSIRGTATNDSASAGFVGEYMEAKNATLTNTGSNGQYADAGTLSLTAGNWLITLQLYVNRNTATWTRVDAGIGTATGNNSAGLSSGDNFIIHEWASSATTPGSICPTVANYRVALSATTSYYGKVRADFSAGQPQFVHRLSAVRIR